VFLQNSARNNDHGFVAVEGRKVQCIQVRKRRTWPRTAQLAKVQTKNPKNRAASKTQVWIQHAGNYAHLDFFRANLL